MTCQCRTVGRESDARCPSCGAPRRRPAGLAVRLLARSIAWTVAAFLLRALFRGGWLIRLTNSAFSFVFGRELGSVVESLVSVVVFLSMLALVAECAVGDRVSVLKPYLRAVGKVLGVMPKVALWSFRVVLYAVEGVEPPKERKASKSRNGKEAPS